jgi:hypothetical protein
MVTRYKCAHCGKTIEEGEFIALLGDAPPSGISTPIGRAEKIFDDIGEMYCKDCLPKIVERDFG